jgi:hypothetical protein
MKNREKQEEKGFYYKNEAGFVLLYRWEILFKG